MPFGLNHEYCQKPWLSKIFQRWNILILISKIDQNNKLQKEKLDKSRESTASYTTTSTVDFNQSHFNFKTHIYSELNYIPTVKIRHFAKSISQKNLRKCGSVHTFHISRDHRRQRMKRNDKPQKGINSDLSLHNVCFLLSLPLIYFTSSPPPIHHSRDKTIHSNNQHSQKP